MVAEEARITDQAIELSEEQKDRLGEKLDLISDVVQDGGNPQIIFTVFEPDKRKTGGRYLEISDQVKKVDPVTRTVILKSVKEVSGVNNVISFDRIVGIRGDLVDYLDDMLLS